MSLVFHGIVVRCSEPEARALFAAVKSKLSLRLVRLDNDVFGVYTERGQLAFGALQRIATQFSNARKAALLYWSDTRVSSWFQLYEHGRMTRELNPVHSRKRARAAWGGGDPLEAIGVNRALHRLVEEAFLYDILDPVAVNHA
jgi:hypothetical protein